MICNIDNGKMVSDLDANHLRILNIQQIVPTPNGLVDTSDSRLSDPRTPIDGSVTNLSVDPSAAISQHKLNFDGDIPAFWLGFDNIHAAPGGQTEYLSNKGIAGGYAGLDGAGKVPVGQLPDDIGTGTVTSVSLVMPADFTVAGSPVTTTGTITVGWADIADGTWFGNNTGGSAVPAFHNTPITTSMVPPLPASKITTGTIDPGRMPPAVGVGPSSSSGIVPDPGTVGDPSDYLGRDMLYHPAPTIGPSYQPKVQSPVLFSFGTGVPEATIGISSPTVGASFFYRLSPSLDYAEVPTSMQITVAVGQTLDVYAARVGYTNSDISTFTQP